METYGRGRLCDAVKARRELLVYKSVGVCVEEKKEGGGERGRKKAMR